MLRSPLLLKKEEQSIYHCVEKPAREGFNFLNNFRKNREDKTWCYKTCICLGHPLQLKPHSEDPLFHDFRGHQSNKFQTL